MNSAAVLHLFRESGALLEGHFSLSSGLHSTGYLQCALVLQDGTRAEMLGCELGEALENYGATAVLSPAIGGLIIGHEVGRSLGVKAIFAERVEKTLMLRRGFSLGPTDRVIIVEDVVTTGLSTRETIEAAQAAGATVVAAASIIDRSNGAADLGVPFHSLAALKLPVFKPEDCPMCKAGNPITKPGSRN